MSKFVTHNAQITSKVGKVDTITIAIDHLLAIPESVVVLQLSIQQSKSVSIIVAQRVIVGFKRHIHPCRSEQSRSKERPCRRTNRG
jgi:hypothetical protein